MPKIPAKNYNFAVRGLWRLFSLRVFRAFVPHLNSRKDAGNRLALLAAGEVRPPEGEIYGSLRKGKIVWHDPSELARDDNAMEAHWKDSANLVGL